MVEGDIRWEPDTCRKRRGLVRLVFSDLLWVTIFNLTYTCMYINVYRIEILRGEKNYSQKLGFSFFKHWHKVSFFPMGARHESQQLPIL
jgi:hypothetical protein